MSLCLLLWVTTWQRTDMGDQAEFHQLMLERVQMLEVALRRAIAGVATQDDWETICTECGVTKASIFKPETRSDK